MAKVTNEMPSGVDEKLKALEAARLQIEKQFGQGSLMKLGTAANAAGIDVIPSGSILLDEALGIGGYPRGRIIEIYGPESSGKTTIALHAIAEAQKLGGIAAFIDAEHALDPVYAKNLGVNIDELWVSQPDTGEQALEIAESLVRSGAVDIIVVDSVAALTPQAEIEGDMGDSHMGLQARLMSQALRKLTATIGKSNSILVFINQIRMKIGVMFGNPETTTGGNALKFYSSVRLEVRKVETFDKGSDEAVGNKVRVKVVKNKVAPPFRKVEMDIIFGKGISYMGSLLDSAVKHELVDKRGAWFAYNEEKIGQGRDNAIAFLEQHPDIAAKLEKQIREKLFPGQKLVVKAKDSGKSGDDLSGIPAEKKTSSTERNGQKTQGGPVRDVSPEEALF
ncbi:MAG: recombinase RecA [Spirochaetes bacterium]|uniref:Protein RecA n=1 Tax=Candidatus Gallitreponema excrementavium TaxID=2840840 RepID=A0A9D9HNZ7_9SPIR|nr:recombinase RecA [Candidatus Gallitreponema excrementavium]